MSSFNVIFYFLPHTNIWDIIKCNLLDKKKDLILDIFTVELISVHNYSKHNCLANKKKKMLKLEQIALFTESTTSSTYSGKKSWKGQSNDKPSTCSFGTKSHICDKEDYWTPEYHYKSIKRNNSHRPKASANLAIKCLLFLGERKVGQMLMTLSDAILNTSILLHYGATFYMFTSHSHATLPNIQSLLASLLLSVDIIVFLLWTKDLSTFHHYFQIVISI